MVRVRNRCPQLGLATIRLWVADTMSSKGTTFILDSNQIKSIINQVNTEITDSWPQPWKSMHYRHHNGDPWCDSDSDDLMTQMTTRLMKKIVLICYVN